MQSFVRIDHERYVEFPQLLDLLWRNAGNSVDLVRASGSRTRLKTRQHTHGPIPARTQYQNTELNYKNYLACTHMQSFHYTKMEAHLLRHPTLGFNKNIKHLQKRNQATKDQKEKKAANRHHHHEEVNLNKKRN